MKTPHTNEANLKDPEDVALYNYQQGVQLVIPKPAAGKVA
jgi:hypothetical protein